MKHRSSQALDKLNWILYDRRLTWRLIMAKEFKFVELNKQLLPQTKGKNLNGVRFYNVDGKN